MWRPTKNEPLSRCHLWLIIRSSICMEKDNIGQLFLVSSSPHVSFFLVEPRSLEVHIPSPCCQATHGSQCRSGGRKRHRSSKVLAAKWWVKKKLALNRPNIFTVYMYIIWLKYPPTPTDSRGSESEKRGQAKEQEARKQEARWQKMEQDARKQEKEQEARGKMQEQAIAGSKSEGARS